MSPRTSHNVAAFKAPLPGGEYSIDPKLIENEKFKIFLLKNDTAICKVTTRKQRMRDLETI